MKSLMSSFRCVLCLLYLFHSMHILYIYTRWTVNRVFLNLFLKFSDNYLPEASLLSPEGKRIRKRGGSLQNSPNYVKLTSAVSEIVLYVDFQQITRIVRVTFFLWYLNYRWKGRLTTIIQGKPFEDSLYNQTRSILYILEILKSSFLKQFNSSSYWLMNEE